MTAPEEPERVEVWQQRDGSWRWRYVAGAGKERVELPSNKPDASRDEAVQHASVAYPGLPLEVQDPRGEDPAEGRGRRRVIRAVVPALVTAAATALTIRLPRWWTLAAAAGALAVTVRRLGSR